MNQEIHTHLEKLKSELSKLEPAVKHLQKADENATALVSSLNNIHREFANHLEKMKNRIMNPMRSIKSIKSILLRKSNLLLTKFFSITLNYNNFNTIKSCQKTNSRQIVGIF